MATGPAPALRTAPVGVSRFAPGAAFRFAPGRRMKLSRLREALSAAADAADAAGALMRLNMRRTKKVDATHAHDIKLELDVRCQRVITRLLAQRFPEVPVLGEEGIDDASGRAAARWVVDPIDGTVNFAHGIPHCCVSIALQVRDDAGAFRADVGVVLDPFVGERWTAIRGQPARLDGRRIHVSRRKKLAETILSLGFAKNDESLDATVAQFRALTPRVRKLRIMGSAALAFVYVADGRFDAYLETGVRLWDVAAGALIVECAGGEPGCTPLPGGDHRVAVACHNGLLGAQLEAFR